MELARAEFTRYTIWHSSHTVPLYELDSAAAMEMMLIDANALGDLLARIRIYSYRHPDRPPFVPVLLQNEELLPIPRWTEVILRERILDAFFDQNDQTAFRSLIAELDIESVSDPEILGLALYERQDLTTSERLQVAGRIAETTEDWEERTRMWCYQGFLWELHDDPKGAARCYLRAVENLPEDPTPRWSYSVVIEAFLQAGRSNSKPALINRALELSSQFLEAAEEFEEVVAIRKSRSEVLKHLQRDREALAEREWIVSNRGTDDDRIQLAQARLVVGDYGAARAELDAINFSLLTPGEQYDYAFTYFGLLYGIDDSQLVDRARRQLELVEPEFPVWREVRRRLLQSLAELPTDADLPTWWATVRGAVMLEPNFFGIGVNLKPILERALTRPKKPPPAG